MFILFLISTTGMLLDAVNQLGIEKNTLIVFTSDNGPENGAGSSGLYVERKRSLQVKHMLIN